MPNYNKLYPTKVQTAMKTFIWIAAVALLVSAVSSEDVLAKWNAFKAEYGKNYLNKGTELHRLNIFKDNLAKIDAHNEQYRKGLVTYHMGINQFADMTNEEFKQYNKLDVNSSQMVKPKGMPFVPKSVVPQDDWIADWRLNGAVTEVKDQGSCGSCWSFSTTGSLEGQHFLTTGQLVSLSEQYLIDCSTSYGNAGCSGGWMDTAFAFVIDNGIYSENAYPYEAIDDNCRQPGEGIVLRATNYYDIAQGSEADLLSAVGTVGPISVAVDASNFQFYSGGVFYDSNCDPNNLNHGVLVVGYGQEGDYEYWMVKNSWGGGWGDGGYLKMIRNYGNNCGIAQAASYPSV